MLAASDGFELRAGEGKEIMRVMKDSIAAYLRGIIVRGVKYDTFKTDYESIIALKDGTGECELLNIDFVLISRIGVIIANKDRRIVSVSVCAKGMLDLSGLVKLSNILIANTPNAEGME